MKKKSLEYKVAYSNAQKRTERALSHSLFQARQEIGGVPLKRIAAHLIGAFHQEELGAIIKEIRAIYPKL
jgi:hypothetical protein